ncbi:hypothetical protein HPB48_011464 [Haemaphysalis longicornis]|uniref:Uncharacterized protein n=1 Tax=Haemaphysalis longicornis TaxID=44386 RepID=A0A9J6FBI3_HAELO|nr:hypothetical protein HPB48_011464 [Haemaphysalis longicornis]
MMAAEEVRLRKAGVTFLNEEIYKKFPGRSFDSVKSHRRMLAYHRLVQELMLKSGELTTIPDPGNAEIHLPEEEVPPQTSDSNPESRPSEPRRDTRQEVSDELARLTLKQPRGGFQGARLWEIAKRCIRGEGVGRPLNDYIRDNFYRDSPARLPNDKRPDPPPMNFEVARGPLKGTNMPGFKTLS